MQFVTAIAMATAAAVADVGKQKEMGKTTEKRNAKEIMPRRARRTTYAAYA